MIMGELIREFYAFCSKHYSFYKFIDYNKNLCFQTSFFIILIRFLWYYKYKHGEIKKGDAFSLNLVQVPLFLVCDLYRWQLT